MVAYVGGKYRIARHIEEWVKKFSAFSPEYVEPFLGGAATMSRNAKHFERAWGFDVVPDLIEMWDAVTHRGWSPPDSVSEYDYSQLRQSQEVSPERGFVGFGCSFGGKWFGGYARSRNGAAPGYDYAAGSRRTVLRQADAMKNVKFSVSDYEQISFDGAVVYADPPYAGTTGYKGTPDFDSKRFWEVATEWSRHSVVLVSEYQAPDGWEMVWEKPMPNYLRGDSQKANQRVERLFLREP